MWWWLWLAHGAQPVEPLGLRQAALEVILEVPVTEVPTAEVAEAGHALVESSEAESCRILSGGYAYMIQALLAITTVSILIFKWSREEPRRDFQVFLLDGSKQLVGAGWAHAFNLVTAVMLNKHIERGDECSWYWVNIMVDTTLGTLVCYGLLKLSMRCTGYQSGNYLTPENTIDATMWIPQVVTWCVIITIMKAGAAVLIVVSQTPLDSFAGAVLGEMTPHWKLLLVMVFTPGIMNAFQFWVQDSFLMWRAPKSEDEDEAENPSAPLNFSAEGRASGVFASDGSAQ